MRWMIEGWVVTIPEGTVKGPEIDFPKKVNVGLFNLTRGLIDTRNKYTAVDGATAADMILFRRNNPEISFHRWDIPLNISARSILEK